jgi:hypothetical protein
MDAVLDKIDFCQEISQSKIWSFATVSGVKQTLNVPPQNVRLWHKADVPACVDLCLLSGAKQPLIEAVRNGCF